MCKVALCITKEPEMPLGHRLDSPVCKCSNVSRDRGPRAVLEASGAVVVLFCLSWRLGPILAGGHMDVTVQATSRML